MRFYSDIEGKEAVVMGDKVIRFKDGIYETDDEREIAILIKSYRSDDNGREAEQGDEGGQEVKEEPSFAELRKQAKEAGIEGYGKMNKASLIKALKEGD